MRILVTAFEPYDQWKTNSSWDALTEWLKNRGVPADVTTRRYPVDLDKLHERLSADLERGFDAVLHLGQAPGSCAIHLEAIALNVAGVTYEPGGIFGPLIREAPVAYRTRCPLSVLRTELLNLGLPASISYHAGTYLCNAAMYLSHHWHAQRGRDCMVGFAHLPLTTEQVVDSNREMPCLPRADLARGIECMLQVLRKATAETSELRLA